jgi:hypothetical protein
MVLPNLLHPVDVVIEQHDESAQVFEDREQMHGQRSTTSITVSAQVRWGSEAVMAAQSSGIREEGDGYILVRKYDLDAAGVTVSLRDKIVSIGWQTGLELFIIREEPIATYPDQDGPTLIKYHFQDRTPVVGTAERT